MRTPTIVFAAAVAAFALSACSPGEELAERVLESQEGVGDIEIDEDDGEIRIEGEGEDGESFSIGGGDLPDDFPIAVPDGGEIQMVMEQGDESSVSIFYEDDFESIVDFYEDWVEDNGEVVNKIEGSNPPVVHWNVEDGDRGYTISVGGGGEGVQVTLGVLPNE